MRPFKYYFSTVRLIWQRGLSTISTRENKMASTTKSIRNKPFVVICGCTGTGKTKLSIELAELLISSGKKAEIINADAMQLYKNLNIITNKATESEMKGIKHHLIGYLDSTCISHVVTDYKNKAVDLIDNLLEQDIIPILVGGTHYYIQSVIWDILIDPNSNESSSISTETRPRKHELELSEHEKQSEIVKLILSCLEEKRESENEESELDDARKTHGGIVQAIDLNVRLHDSKISNEEIYKQLELVDQQSAQKIHPNDRRKLCRALEIYYTYGTTKSELLETKTRKMGTSLPLRYKNVCMFMLNCEIQTLNPRLDGRVDKMIEMGLLKEINEFKDEFENAHKGKTFREYSRDFEFGIFQSIGFKEFEDYMKYIDEISKNREIQLEKIENDDSDNVEQRKQELFEMAVSEMKQTTRRYAKTQLKWVRNRFIKRADQHSPRIHELDTTDLTKWEENIFNKASGIFNDYLNRYQKDPQTELNRRTDENELANSKPEQIFEFNKCEICDRVFVHKDQWIDHLNGAKHKKKKDNLRKREAREAAQKSTEAAAQQESDPKSVSKACSS